MSVSESDILAALKAVKDPERGQDIVALGMVAGMQVREGHVAFAIEVPRERAAKLEPLRKEAERVVEALAGALSVSAVVTAEAAPRGRAAPRSPQREEAKRVVEALAGLLSLSAVLPAEAAPRGRPAPAARAPQGE